MEKAEFKFLDEYTEYKDYYNKLVLYGKKFSLQTVFVDEAMNQQSDKIKNVNTYLAIAENFYNKGIEYTERGKFDFSIVFFSRSLFVCEQINKIYKDIAEQFFDTEKFRKIVIKNIEYLDDISNIKSKKLHSLYLKTIEKLKTTDVNNEDYNKQNLENIQEPNLYNELFLQNQKNDKKKEEEINHWNYNEKEIRATNLENNGIYNIGNTCYMNSVIQCLSVTSFGEFCLNQKIKLTPESLFCCVIWTFNLLKYDKNYAITPHHLKNRFGTINPSFSNNMQQDAHEFLVKLLDNLHDELNNNKNIKLPYVEIDNENGTDEEILSLFVKNYIDRNVSPIVDIFMFQERTLFVCSRCGKKRQNYSFLSILDLPIPTEKSNISIQDCLDEFTKKDVLVDDNMLECKKCNKKTKTIKQSSMHSCPKILILCLNRFKKMNNYISNVAKINNPIAFQKNINITNYNSNKNKNNSECNYKLVGVVNHMGSLYGGHYTADIYDKTNDIWVNYSDSSISIAEMPDFCHGYILFYEQC
jgi:ubiquitin C-terminal hydrolase